jgi:hypothetical protein
LKRGQLTIESVKIVWGNRLKIKTRLNYMADFDEDAASEDLDSLTGVGRQNRKKKSFYLCE